MTSRERGGILTGLLITGAVGLCLLIACGLFIARNIRVTSRSNGYGGDNVWIDTPAGNFSIRAHEKDGKLPAGIPMYPGARLTHGSGGGAVFRWNSKDGNDDRGFAVAGAEMITGDPPSKVLDYYREQLPEWIVVTEHDGATQFELQEGGYKRIVGIHAQYDGTHIGVASVGEPASN
ncbi:MAG TPA: hypothetical protein VG297_15290 [Bryobacteraceae bacterium]|jgi:hypothetical protein|nr:hypothetical protein [Bryobacteraceae bacterium]